DAAGPTASDARCRPQRSVLPQHRTEPEALAVHYYLAADGSGDARITVTDAGGRQLRQMNGPAKRGMNRALVSVAGAGRGGRGAAAGGGGVLPESAPLAVGDYILTVDNSGNKPSKKWTVRARIQ
ncbi:MAG: hypothetical protein ABIP65_08405, partial [Vicinamibacterales bacterium]